MNPYSNHTFKQLIDVITKNYYLENTTITEACEIAYKKMATERDGILLVRALRKANAYLLSEDHHKKLKSKYPNSSGLKSEALWLKFSNKVCDGNNNDFIKDAEYILENSSQNEVASKLIYEVTVLITISRLLRDNDFNQAYIWTTKLNPNKLSDEGRMGNNGYFYPSNKQQFYNYKSKSLIGTHRVKFYVDWVFKYLKFTEQKRNEFVAHIIESCTYTKYDGSSFISDMVLSNFLYKLDVDLISRSTNLASTVNQPNTVLLSELSQYLFCPVSFVINKTYNIPNLKPMDSSSIWLGNKDGFYDRYLKYQKTRNIAVCFENDALKQYVNQPVVLEDDAIPIFEELFKGKITINNYFDTSPKTFNSDDNTLKGAPDYVVELTNGKRVLIAEKFSSNKAVGASKVYNSDIIDIEAYLTKFKNIKIDYAYFINWTWSTYKVPKGDFEQETKISYVNKANIHLINIKTSREALVDSTSEKINILKSGKMLKFNEIGFPSKCLNCSVYNYCEHKSGTQNTLRFPYSV